MAHSRQTIREATVSAISGLTSTGDRVYQNRVSPFFTLPSLNVMTIDESVRDDLGGMDNTQIRELRLIIEGRASGSTTPDNTIDTIADEVEEAILNNSTLDTYAFDLTLDSTSFSYDNEGDHPVAKVEMIYSFLYQVDLNDPSVIL